MFDGLFLGALLLLLISVFVPGFLIVWAIAGGKLVSCLFALPVGLGALGALTFIYGYFPFAWSPGIFVVLFLISAVLSALRILKSSDSFRRREFEASFPLKRADLVLLGLAIAVFAVLTLRQWQDATGSVANISSYGDAAFHYSALRKVTESGNVNSFNSLNEMYSHDGNKDVYYPVFWHALAATLVPWVGLARATAVLSAFLGLIVWPVSLATISWALKPGRPIVFLVTPGVAFLVIPFPTIILYTNAMYPFSLALVLLPAALSLSLMAISAKQWPWWILSGVVTIGILAAQPTTFGFVLILLFAYMTVSIIRQVRLRWEKSRLTLRLAMVGGGILSVFLVVWALYLFSQTPLVVRVGAFNRMPFGYKEEAVKILANYLSVDWVSFLRLIWWIFGLIGCVRLWRTHLGRIALLASFLYFLVLLAAIGPESWARRLTGFWYKDELRLEAFNYIWFVVFVAVGFAHCDRLLSKKVKLLRGHEVRRLVVGCLVFVMLMAPFAKRDMTLKRAYIELSQSSAVESVEDE